MFTGIVEEIGTVEAVRKGASSAAMRIGAKEILSDIKVGDSIAVNGICMTVTSFDGKGFWVDVMPETLSRSSIGKAARGSAVNLERAMLCGGRFGGHIVSGHIDGTGTILEVQADDNAVWYTIAAEKGVMRYIVEKGSVAIDGISLTVAKVQEERFSVSVIPHTREKTILSRKKAGDIVNLENDVIGKYVEKLLQTPDTEKKPSNISKEFLLKNGF
ncbi:MAG: riboflavin synthase [Roseburia sp.]|nr:riboflavin synthase [Roseburia sp.]